MEILTLSIRRKLGFIVWTFAVMIGLITVVAYFGFTGQATIRAYVAAENLWSKSEKSAVTALQRYVLKEEAQDLAIFLKQLELPAATQRVRLEILKTDTNFDVVYQALIETKNDPSEVREMGFIMKWAQGIRYIDEALAAWSLGDLYLEHLKNMALRIQHESKNKKLTEVQKNKFLHEIFLVEQDLNIAELKFSTTLSDGGRWFKQRLIWTLCSLSLLLLILGLSISYFVSKSILRQIEHLRVGAAEVEKGNLTQMVPVISNDELGQLATVFNQMTASLSQVTRERNHAQQAFELRARQLSEAQATAHLGSWDWDLTTQQIFWSEELYKIMNQDPRAFIPTYEKIMQGLPAAEKASLKEAIKKATEEGTPFAKVIRIQRAAEDFIYLHIQARVIRSPEGRSIRMLGTAQDITERQQLQAQLVQANKMASLGEMAGGVAHEINTPLGVITLLTSHARRLHAENKLELQALPALLEKLEAMALRIAKIVKGLRSFSREGAGDIFEDISIESVIEDTLSLCEERFKSQQVKFFRNQALENVTLAARSVQIAQVLLNLLHNASDAVSGTPDPWIRLEVIERNESVELRITDSGKGIPLLIQEKIFQPFFTTKDVGTGTGLGLSISMGIIRDHGGQLEIDNNCPNTCFVIRLPKWQNLPLTQAS